MDIDHTKVLRVRRVRGVVVLRNHEGRRMKVRVRTFEEALLWAIKHGYTVLI